MEDKHANSPSIVVKSTGGLSPVEARDIRARALRFALDCHAKKKAAEKAQPGGYDDTEVKSSDDSRADKASIPR